MEHAKALTAPHSPHDAAPSLQMASDDARRLPPDAAPHAATHLANPVRWRETESIRKAAHRATDWVDLFRRLRALGYDLSPTRDGGLMVRSWPRGRPVLRLEELGFDMGALVMRFGQSWPGPNGRRRRSTMSVPMTRAAIMDREDVRAEPGHP
ncbi:hypothetical protein LV82_00237 [Albidovulum inexpectatum]|uniref:Uncharacterized protein n=1 Tax=Albidovulum inexpectatum TaxID=196587 RepID=A0A2S5JLE0_9RHOB|nr:hypothetical protein [Albidovulum inexpectatum]PPB82309.1 hypothetical protein LV82_00237 [Albidovulum inexpectatum]